MTNPANTNSAIRMNYLGLLRSTVSWAQVGRELVVALDELGCDVSVSQIKGFQFDPSFKMHPRIEELCAKPRHKDVEITFEYPLNYYKLQARVKLGLMVYETSPLPAHWVGPIKENLDRLVVPTQFCRRIALESGVPEKMIEVVPYGYNPELFRPDAPPREIATKRRFRFLHIAPPHRRKATRELIRAYVREFSGKDDCALVIKSNYVPPGNVRWETPPLDAIIAEELRAKASDPPEIVAIVAKEPVESMPGYFTACDCYVQPSYSEGFGLCILEAMACMRPAIVNGWGGQMDFCNERNSYITNYELIPAGDVQYDNESERAMLARPDVTHLARLLREIYANPDAARRKAEIAFEENRHLTWSYGARMTIDVIKKVLNGKL